MRGVWNEPRPPKRVSHRRRGSGDRGFDFHNRAATAERATSRPRGARLNSSWAGLR